VSRYRVILLLVLFGGSCNCCDDDIKHLCHFDYGIDGGMGQDANTTATNAKALTENCVVPLAPDARASECGDDFEPNDDFVLAATSSSRECTTTMKSGSIGGRDIDVFRTGNCCIGYGCASPIPVATEALKPWAEVSAPDPSIDLSGLRVCVFPTCDEGSTHILKCYEDGATDTTTLDLFTSQLGFRGCCRTGPGKIAAELDCPRRSPKFDTYVWIEQQSGGSCQAYNVTYNAGQ
jgi:hypothetical protein